MKRILQPPGWPQAKGYSNGVVARGTLVFVAGQVGWTPEGVFESDRFSEQLRQALLNTLAVLAEAPAGPEQIVRMTWYITTREEYLDQLKEVGQVWRELMGKNYPPMSVVEVSALVESRAKVEVEVTAVIPDES